MPRPVPTGLIVLAAWCPAAIAADPAAVAKLDPHVAAPADRPALARTLSDHARVRRNALVEADHAEWRCVRTRADWEAFVRPRISRLKASLGTPPAPSPLRLRVTGTVPGDGFVIENVVYESRPGLWVTANRYRPEPPRASMPGLLLSHAHHTPKEHGELQDMGMTWARAGCVVLVPDHLGHGERRQHPFADASTFAKPFRVSRQDYFFRYDLGVQLHLAGESLIGWMAFDLMRGVDVLLATPGVDPKRIALLGAVAGGGDPAAVTAAIDPRIAAVVPFNFGGPQPETRYPLPADAETSFDYAGGGSWESTRNLRRSAADGFLPWTIVASVAPRRLVYGHEFRWDRDRDPVWKRLNAVFEFHDAADRLAFAHGRGLLSGQPPEASHCTHIGPVHRETIHEAFHRWFDIDATEYSRRVEPSKLRCWTDAARTELRPKPLCDVLGALAVERITAADPTRLRETWAKLLGGVEAPKATANELPAEAVGGATLRRVMLTTEPGVRVPLLLLTPIGVTSPPVVVGVGAGGKASFLATRAGDVSELLAAGVAVCLADVRGTGETAVRSGRGRTSAATAVSSSVLMNGDTVIGGQLRDLRAVLAWLRGRGDVNGRAVAVWGDSTATTNAKDANFQVPRDDDAVLPRQSEPGGAMLALLAGLYEPDVKAVYTRGGVTGFSDVLATHLVTIPHDAVVPGVLTAGDLPALAKALGPTRLRFDAPVDGQNRRVGEDGGSPVTWLVDVLKK